jgi:hypothetical protein
VRLTSFVEGGSARGGGNTGDRVVPVADLNPHLPPTVRELLELPDRVASLAPAASVPTAWLTATHHVDRRDPRHPRLRCEQATLAGRRVA